MNSLPKGTQVVYMPTHARGNNRHPDVEHGFVMVDEGDNCYVHYWSKINPDYLRTVANSEYTSKGMLEVRPSRSQWRVDAMIKQVEGGKA